MERRRKNNIIIGTLCSILVLMGVGYAILSTTLNIGATANITGDFDIHFTNIQRSSSTISDSSILSTIDAGTGITANTNSHAGTFTAVLQKPTDYVIYTVSVANTGSIDGYLTFSFEDTNSNFDYYKDFYSVEFIRDDVNPAISTDILQPNASFSDPQVLVNTSGTRTYKIKVTYKESATSFPDPTHEINNEQVGNFECSLNLTYSQQAPSQGGSSEVCYTPLNETKQLRKINASTGESLGTATSSNLSVGDLVGYGTSDISSNEQFYILENNNGQLKLLSRYLINVSYTDSNQNSHQRSWDNCSRDTRGLQDSRIGFTRTNVNVAADFGDTSTFDVEAADFENQFFYGAVPFSSTNYWYDETNNQYVSPFTGNSFVYNSSSTLKSYVDSYATTLSSMGLTGATGTVLSIQELGSICNYNFIDKSGSGTCPNYIYETTYWLGSARDSDGVWGVLADGSVSNHGFGNDGDTGVRPVINVSLS